MAPAGVDAGTRTFGCILGRGPVPIWGLSSEERLRRLFVRAGVTSFVREGEKYPPGSIVFVRADFLYDERVLRGLVQKPGTVLELEETGRRVAAGAHVPSERAAEVARWLREETMPDETAGLRVETAALVSSSYQLNLRKTEFPVVLRIRPEERDALERHLFSGSYKGVTDLVTKWVWPTPALWVTRLCAKAHIRPNTVTYVSLALVFIVIVLFAQGRYALGLALGWLMTFLDTVDGKLARVTLQTSKFGNILDHGIDLIHPPFWYIAWALSLPGTTVICGFGIEALVVTIVVGYIASRLVEGTFELMLGRFGIFCWRPIDSYFRLIVARRNPNMLMLTASAIARRPDLGLLSVAVWTAACTVLLFLRLVVAFVARWRTSGPLRSWLAEIDATDAEPPRFARPFIRQAKPSDSTAG